MYFRPISLQLEVGPEPHSEDADWSVTPAEEPWKVSIPLQAPSRKTSLLSKLTLAPAIRSYSPTAFLKSLYIQAAGYKHGDIIGERGNPCRMRDTALGRNCPLIPKPSRAGPNARLQTPSNAFRSLVPLPEVVVHHANPSAELRFESGSL